MAEKTDFAEMIRVNLGLPFKTLSIIYYLRKLTSLFFALIKNALGMRKKFESLTFISLKIYFKSHRPFQLSSVI